MPVVMLTLADEVESRLVQKGRKSGVHRSASEMAESRGRKKKGARTFTRTSPERLGDGSDSDDSLYSGHRDSGVVSEHPSENVPSFSDIVPEVFEKKEPIKIPPKAGPENVRKDGRAEKTKVEKLKEDAKRATIRQHYYPEGGWGWVVTIAGTCNYFFVGSTAMLVGLILFDHLPPKLGRDKSVELKGWLGSLSLAVPLMISPLTIALCRRKSTRLAAVLGGLIAALGCLFSSFASQFPQLFLSYGIIFGAGVGLTRDTATLMVGQYFKRRRELVEIVLMSGTGVGMAVMAAIIQGTLSSIGWRLGLQVVTCIILLSSLFGCCYRSASLYHPQRRAILHLKNQRRKIKDKTKIDDKPPLFDFSTLRSKTIRILLVSTGISYFGILSPLVLLVREVEKSTTHPQSQLLILHLMMGMAWVLGCASTGLLIVKKPKNFLIGRQYITQISSMVAGIAILSLGSHEESSPQSFQMFSFVYGFSTGAYSYALKLYVYEKVRARNFSRAWSFVQFAQGLPLMVGIPLSGFLNEHFTSLLGFYISGSAVCLGSFLMFLIDVRKYLITRKNRKAHRHKHHHIKSSESTHSRLKFAGPDSEVPVVEEVCEEGRCTPSCKESIRRDSFADEDDLMAPLAIINQTSLAALGGQFGDPLVPELTCISEEGIADMDIPDHLFEEFEFEMNLGPDDEISSCDKVENCLVLSEYENNLIKHNESSQGTEERRSRRWSIFKLGPRDHRSFRASSFRKNSTKILDPFNQKREIDVIEEASI